MNWIDERNGDTDVFVVASRDGGESWGAPVRVNDDPRGNGGDQLFTWMSVDPFTCPESGFYGDYLAISAVQGRVVAAWPHCLEGGELALSAALFSF